MDNTETRMDEKPRKCLKCLKYFPSQSRSNRICKACKKKQSRLQFSPALNIEPLLQRELLRRLGPRDD